MSPSTYIAKNGILYVIFLLFFVLQPYFLYNTLLLLLHQYSLPPSIPFCISVFYYLLLLPTSTSFPLTALSYPNIVIFYNVTTSSKYALFLASHPTPRFTFTYTLSTHLSLSKMSYYVNFLLHYFDIPCDATTSIISMRLFFSLSCFFI